MVLRIRARARCAITKFSCLFALTSFVFNELLIISTRKAYAYPLTSATVRFGISQDGVSWNGNLRPLSIEDFELTRILHNNKNLLFNNYNNKQVSANPRFDATFLQPHQQQYQSQQQAHHIQGSQTPPLFYNLPGTRPVFDARILLNSRLEPTSQLASEHSNNGTRLAPVHLRKALMSLQNPQLLGGDMILWMPGKPRKDRLFKFERSALVSPVSLWPRAVIFYELDDSVAHLSDLIWKVMQQFHDETCIRFEPRRQSEPDYIRIEALKGCFSYIGRIGGEQTVSLGDGCEYRGTIAHELLHSVGFFHHQNRSDRDEYLEIVWDNIARGKESQFIKMAPHENILLNKFDYNSVMLYGPYTFGKTLDRVTMKPKQEGITLLEVMEKQGLSPLDIDSVNKLYECKNTNM